MNLWWLPRQGNEVAHAFDLVCWLLIRIGVALMEPADSVHIEVNRE